MRKIVFLGLSDKPGKAPFDETTPAGKVVLKIVERLSCDDQIYKRNLVPFAPLTEDGKLRYPTLQECMEGYSMFLSFINQVKPHILICFGKQVSQVVKKKDLPNLRLYFFPHPSYIWVYKRKNLESYLLEIVNSICEMHDSGSSRKKRNS